MEIPKKPGRLIEKERFQKWFKKDNLIILVLFGVLLMVIAMPSKNRQKPSSSEEDKTASGQEGENESSVRDSLGEESWLSGAGEKEAADAGSEDSEGEGGISVSGTGFDPSRYTALLEERLTGFLSKMDGVGKVSVMITLESSEELVLEKDMPVQRSNTTENDSEGGSRSIYQVDSGESTVYSTDGGKETPYVIKTLTPKIEGVVVLAQGAGTARITADITEAVQALFGIEAHKVKVLRMRTNED